MKLEYVLDLVSSAWLCMFYFYFLLFACVVESSPVENFLKAERAASVNSYKSK